MLLGRQVVAVGQTCPKKHLISAVQGLLDQMQILRVCGRKLSMRLARQRVILLVELAQLGRRFLLNLGIWLCACPTGISFGMSSQGKVL